MRDVASAFTGRFKAQHSSYHNWLPVSDVNTPRPHPAQVCLNDSRQQTDARLNFVKRHTLMDLAVPAYGGAPVVAMTSFHFRLTHVAVDWQVRAADGRYYDVIFMGTDDGRVIKAINSGRGAAIHTVFIEDIQVSFQWVGVGRNELFVRRCTQTRRRCARCWCIAAPGTRSWLLWAPNGSRPFRCTAAPSAPAAGE